VILVEFVRVRERDIMLMLVGCHGHLLATSTYTERVLRPTILADRCRKGYIPATGYRCSGGPRCLTRKVGLLVDSQRTVNTLSRVPCPDDRQAIVVFCRRGFVSDTQDESEATTQEMPEP
jgi:hypothetical protein